jgi:C2HE / C2H2 / C2HC zinc-binding finger
LFKENLQCWRCHASQKNIPALKDHLEEEWKLEKEKALLHQKRKREEPIVVSSGQETDDDDDAGRARQRKRPKDSPALENQTTPDD